MWLQGKDKIPNHNAYFLQVVSGNSVPGSGQLRPVDDAGIRICPLGNVTDHSTDPVTVLIIRVAMNDKREFLRRVQFMDKISIVLEHLRQIRSWSGRGEEVMKELFYLTLSGVTYGVWQWKVTTCSTGKPPCSWNCIVLSMILLRILIMTPTLYSE